MKKIIILLMPLLLTGCLSLNGNLSNTCTRKEVSQNIEEEITYVIDFKAGEINKITLTSTYKNIKSNDISYITNSIKSYKKAYENENGVMVTADDNSITYEFDMHIISDEVKKQFNLTSNYNDQIKKLKESGAECK